MSSNATPGERLRAAAAAVPCAVTGDVAAPFAAMLTASAAAVDAVGRGQWRTEEDRVAYMWNYARGRHQYALEAADAILAATDDPSLPTGSDSTPTEGTPCSSRTAGSRSPNSPTGHPTPT